MGPLEERERLVDERQDVHAHWLRCLLHLNCSIEILDGFLVFLLIEEKFAVVVVHIRNLVEVLNAPAECRHRRCDATHLVLCYAELNV